MCSQLYTRLSHIVLRYRCVLVVWLHLSLIVLAGYLAFWLRFDGAIPQGALLLCARILPWFVVVQGLTFVPFSLYRGLWRYTSVWDLRNIILAVVVGVGLSFLLTYWVFGLRAIPRSIFAIDALLLICLLSNVRLARRLVRTLSLRKFGKRVLVYGAGDAGEMIVRDMKNNPFYTYEPIGFVDDDPLKVGKHIHGVRVLGTRQHLPQIMASRQPHEVLVAMPRVEPATIRSVVKALEPFKVPITTLPNMQDLLDGKAKITVSQLRNLAVKDLLDRVPVGLNPQLLRHLVTGKCVMVTGAGGSIGSELCRQIIALQPHMLILLERYENALYFINNELACYDGAVEVQGIIGDVTDSQRVHAILGTFRPQIVFHAAAHKHVPLMEANPCEAVKNNVLGTRLMAEAAAQYGTERFILISSDKAVNPSSIMGATKRVAELLVLQMAQKSQTRFLAVRFGNVLGSNGSVVPHFLAQIEQGGPVTVTHPEMRRYFMLIPEAVQLVLHAAALGQRGALYVLKMGEQIKVLDMARNLIHLAGLTPEKDIPIIFVGLRPGEKLFEELVGVDETVLPSGVEDIVCVQPRVLPEAAWLTQQVAALERAALHGDAAATLRMLRTVVPTFQSSSMCSEIMPVELGQKVF